MIRFHCKSEIMKRMWRTYNQDDTSLISKPSFILWTWLKIRPWSPTEKVEGPNNFDSESVVGPNLDGKNKRKNISLQWIHLLFNSVSTQLENKILFHSRNQNLPAPTTRTSTKSSVVPRCLTYVLPNCSSNRKQLKSCTAAPSRR